MLGFFPVGDHNQTLRIKTVPHGIWIICHVEFYGVFLHFQEPTRVTFNVLIISLLGILAVNIVMYAIFRTGLNKTVQRSESDAFSRWL